MTFRVDDLSESKVRKHGEVTDASQIAGLLAELEAEAPRVWNLWVPHKSGITFAFGGGVCGLVQWAVEGGPPWWFLRSATLSSDGGGPCEAAQWNGAPWELFPADLVTREELQRVLETLVSTGGKRDPNASWEKIDG